jgi:hypothetical protein
LQDLSVQAVRGIASAKGINSVSVMGNDRLVEFSFENLTTSIHMNPDMETFPAISVLRLIVFFSQKLSKLDFWPAAEQATG